MTTISGQNKDVKNPSSESSGFLFSIKRKYKSCRRFLIKYNKFAIVLTGIGVFAAVNLLYPHNSLAMNGSGTSADPYQVANCTDLQNIGTTGYYELTANIDCTGVSFQPIDNYNGTSYSSCFNGMLNGNGYTISNLSITESFSTNSPTNNVGLFGCNVNSLFNINISTETLNVTLATGVNANIGGISGEDLSADPTASSNTNAAIYYSNITGLSTTVNEATGNSANVNIGGLVGEAETNIYSSYSAGSISSNGANDILGGISGLLNVTSSGTSTLQNDYSTVNLTETNANGGSGLDNVGGLAGELDGYSNILDSYDAATLTLDNTVGTTAMVADLGGLVGADGTNSTSSVFQNDFIYSALAITNWTNYEEGALTGGPLHTTATGVYFDETKAGTSNCGPYSGDSNLCTAVNTTGTQGTYFDGNSSNAPLNSWDFTNTWTVNSSALPTLEALNLSTVTVPNISYTIETSSSIILNWSTAQNISYSMSPTDYVIEYEVSGSNSWTTIDTNSTNLSYTVSNLAANTLYTFEVKAVYTMLISSSSQIPVEISGNIPDAPTNVQATAYTTSTNEIVGSVSWTAPANENQTNFPVLDTYVMYEVANTNSWTTVNTNLADATTYTIPNLTANQTYEVEVYATNSVGQGTVSSAYTFSTTNPQPLPLPVPTNFTALAARSSSVLIWNTTSVTGYLISSYTVNYKPASSSNWQSQSINTALTSDPTGYSENTQGISEVSGLYTVTSLTPGVNYDFEVIANYVSSNGDQLGSSSASNEATSTPLNNGSSYTVTSCQQLENMRNDLNGNYTLGNNIDCSGSSSWNSNDGFWPIGTPDIENCLTTIGQAPPQNDGFTGTLNGNGYTISGLSEDYPSASDQCMAGIFGYTIGANVSDLRISSPDITDYSDSIGCGAVSGASIGGSFSNIEVDNATINCTTAGGLVGNIQTTNNLVAKISQVSTSGNISVVNNNGLGNFISGLGGIIGVTLSNLPPYGINIDNSYSSANLTLCPCNDNFSVGGLAGTFFGYNYSTTYLNVNNSYASGTISLSSANNVKSVYIGGIAGLTDGGAEINNSFSVIKNTIQSSMFNPSLSQYDYSGAMVGLTGENQSYISNSSNYYDAAITRFSACSGLYSLICTPINNNNNQPSYFYNNETNSPLNNWDFKNIWKTTSTLPMLLTDWKGNGGGPTCTTNCGAPPPTTPVNTSPITPIISISPVGLVHPNTTGNTSNNKGSNNSWLEKLISKIPNTIAYLLPWILLILLMLVIGRSVIQLTKERRVLKNIEDRFNRLQLVNQEKSTFVDLASHYLRTPTALIAGGIELLASTDIGSSPEISQAGKIVSDLKLKVEKLINLVYDHQSPSQSAQPAKPLTAPSLVNGVLDSSPKTLVARPSFWMPVVFIGVSVMLVDYLFFSFKHLHNGTLNDISQAIIYLVLIFASYIALRGTQIYKKDKRSAENLLKNQQELAKKTNSFVQAAYRGLSPDTNKLTALITGLPEGNIAAKNLTNGVNRLNELVSKFGLLTQLRDSDVINHLETVDLTDLVSKVNHELGPDIRLKGLRVNMPKKAIEIGSSAALLKVVIKSIMDNAIKYSLDGGTVNITVTKHSNRATLKISDNGHGINPSDLPHLFKPFSMIKTGNYEGNSEGLGLSLYIDKIILDQLGSYINVSSSPTGTDVEIELKNHHLKKTKTEEIEDLIIHPNKANLKRIYET